MRIATYNVEWFDSLFDDEGELLEDDQWSARYKVTRRDQLESLGIVFTALDADAVMIIEAPDSSRKRSSIAALERFAARYDIRVSKAVSGFANHTQQEITLLYDPSKLTVAHDPQGNSKGQSGPDDVPRFDGVYRLDLDVDMTNEKVSFSKPPLELAVQTSSGFSLRMIGVHVKSKAPYGAKSPEEAMRIAIENRRKQLAQCIWIRKRVEQHLDVSEPVIVLGDFNDGPGLDEYEKLFGRSGVEVVLGDSGQHSLYDPHAREILTRHVGAKPVSARFYIREEDRYLSALLDYIMLSRDLCERGAQWRIWHPFDDASCYRVPELREALLAASDHFPVSVDLDI